MRIDEEKAKYVVLIFFWYVEEGRSRRAWIASELNRLKAGERTIRPRRLAKRFRWIIQGILAKNTSYWCAKVMPNSVRGFRDAAVSPGGCSTIWRVSFRYLRAPASASSPMSSSAKACRGSTRKQLSTPNTRNRTAAWPESSSLRPAKSTSVGLLLCKECGRRFCRLISRWRITCSTRP